MSQIAIWLICGKYEWPAAASGHKAFIRENGRLSNFYASCYPVGIGEKDTLMVRNSQWLY